ncbi:MAG TPA: NifB/NifX family molybdenum-iron cluster-binding protein [bacterium]|nr:NifB/NifX family molybdenum-iron cluster-binding protein [bacterium]HQG46898.1 NifB/NifX family molybdenum-iron cluster-binding protein [bacterium]HQI47988.1 NifB/NifX family molybdenum-iron cluster-binding protein [bacterium]HQJ65611.1 NifB/NifX family molybdenum-iron cluster-binding protein [bacterium]
MKIAIPIANSMLCAHFGHCEQFALITVDAETRTILGREDVIPPPHEPGLLPGWLAERDAQVIIAGGMGQRAQMLFTDHKIQVIVGAPTASPEELAREYLAGSLQSGVNTCDH